MFRDICADFTINHQRSEVSPTSCGVGNVVSAYTELVCLTIMQIRTTFFFYSYCKVLFLDCLVSVWETSFVNSGHEKLKTWYCQKYSENRDSPPPRIIVGFLSTTIFDKQWPYVCSVKLNPPNGSPDRASAPHWTTIASNSKLSSTLSQTLWNEQAHKTQCKHTCSPPTQWTDVFGKRLPARPQLPVASFSHWSYLLVPTMHKMTHVSIFQKRSAYLW